MSEQPARTIAEFDAYAGDYDAALERGISISGEDKDYFARGRVQWLARVLDWLGERPARVMDFGCGTGSATPFILEMLPDVTQLVGIDVSGESLELARSDHGSTRARFQLLKERAPDTSFDMAVSNGVFHHIQPRDRPDALRYVHDSLRPGGLFALWENNPWNPGTRYVMSRIAFDRDAVLISPFDAQIMLRRANFQVLRTDFLFVFPRILRTFRGLEPVLSRFPLGAQYLVLCRKRSKRTNI